MNARRLLLTLTVLFGLPGAALAQRPASQELVWPLPPEPPRIKYFGQLSNEQDVGKKQSFFTRLKNNLAGTQGSVIGVQRPHDVVVDGGDRFFVSDGARGKLVLFDTEAQAARIVGDEGQGYLRKPLGLGGDGNGTIYVADGSGSRVVAFDRDGNYLRAYGGEDVLLNPADVAVDPQNNALYVVDSYLHQVVVFTIDTGELMGKIGKDVDDLASKREELRGQWQGGIHGARDEEDLPADAVTEAEPEGAPRRDLVDNRGSEPGEFRYPAFIDVGPDGTIYVSDQMNFRVQAFDPAGEFVRQIGSIGQTPGTFARPKGVAVDTQGHVYVADGAFNNVQIFDPSGQLLLVFGQIGTGEGQVYLPLGMSVDDRNRIYIADRYNNRVQVFEFFPLDDEEQAAYQAAREGN